MKVNLKTFPKFHWENPEDLISDIAMWKEDFEAELDKIDNNPKEFMKKVREAKISPIDEETILQIFIDYIRGKLDLEEILG